MHTWKEHLAIWEHFFSLLYEWKVKKKYRCIQACSGYSLLNMKMNPTEKIWWFSTRGLNWLRCHHMTCWNISHVIYCFGPWESNPYVIQKIPTATFRPCKPRLGRSDSGIQAVWSTGCCTLNLQLGWPHFCFNHQLSWALVMRRQYNCLCVSLTKKSKILQNVFFFFFFSKNLVW